MNKIYEIIRDTCQEYRNGADVIINGEPATQEQKELLWNNPNEFGNVTGGVVEIFDMLSTEVAPKNLVLVDLVFISVGVNKEKAEAKKNDLIEWLKNYPEPERLAEGPSYIELGATIGDQQTALCLIALGDVLGLWKAITPMTLGIVGDQAKELAGKGLIMLSGFSPEKVTINS